MNKENLLAGDRLRLTGFRRTDASTILRWRDDTRFLRLWNSDPLTERSEAQILEWIERIDKAGREITFAIRLQKEEDLIGIVGLDEIEWPKRVAKFRNRNR